jgi:small subunit ribosomal protein S20
MAHTPSAKKRLRQNVKRRQRNRATERDVKEQIKKVLSAAQAGGAADQLQAELRLAAKKLDKAAARRVLHPNTAARKKAQLARLVNQKAARSS